MPEAPLVVTLRCDGPGWQYCEDLRKQHFPPARNIVPAHIALFHHLPGEDLKQIEGQARHAAIAQPAFEVQAIGVRSLGRGVALIAESVELQAIHRSLSATWAHWLIPQDRSRLSPHITIQNKVTAQEAASLLAALRQSFVSFSIHALGLDIWHYRNGPWEHAAFAPFAQPT